MCGIAGFIDFDGHRVDQARQRVKRMTDSIAHRGPDADGFYVDHHVALGHRRLSIIDVSTGQQPMAALDGQVQITFNGEIYNYQEVRAELRACGHHFRTQSDTEVILLGYVQWGDQVLERLNGMFAFVIWDARERRVLMARDRVGKKPLYYYRHGSTIAFASELKALRAGGWGGADIDPQALDCYLSLGYVPAPKTIYADVRKLQPARALTLTATSAVERQYWKLSFGNPKPYSLDTALEEFEPLLDDAVQRRLMSEVPLGAFLSGGLDSSLVVSSMSKVTGRPVATHTIGFGEREVSEAPIAREIAAYLGANHHEFVVEPHAADVLEKIAWHCDEPLADSSALPTWYVCQMTRQSVTVALSGDGGDEALGGYTFRYVPHVLESKIRAAIPTPLRSLVFGPLGRLWPASARLPQPLRLKTIFENLSVSDAEAFYRDLIWLREDTRRAVYRPEYLESLKGFTPFEQVHDYYSRNDAVDALGRSQFADIHVYMTDDVLVKVDRMSMAHALEVRSPLLDYRILEFAAKLPAELKIKGKQGKVLLRALAARRLPEKIRSLPKRGFSIPAARWLRQELRPMAESLIFDSNGICAGTLQRPELDRLWREHLSGARDHSVFIWGLMMLGLWERTAATAAQSPTWQKSEGWA